MAVDFAHYVGVRQTCLVLDMGSAPNLPFSFATFFKPRNPGSTDQTMVSFAVPTGTGDGFRLDLKGSQAIQADVNDFVSIQSSTTTDLCTLDAWNHGAAVFAGTGAPGSTPATSATVYLNGNPATPLTGITLTPDNTRWVLIGGHSTVSSSAAGFEGCLAHVAAWNIALSDAQVALLAAGTLPNDHATLGTTSGDLIGYWALDDEATATIATVGSDLTLYEHPPQGVITTCSDSPEIPEPEPEPAEGCDTEDEADEIAAADVTWPECDLVPEDISIEVASSTISPGRALSGREQIIQPDAGRWRIELIGIKVWSTAELLLWRQTESILNGRNGTALIPLYEAPLSTTPVTAVSGDDYEIGDVRIGYVQTAGAAVVPGQHFSIGERGYRIKRVFGTDGGITSVLIWPPLRAAVSLGATLNFNTPRVRCRLERDSGMAIDLNLLRFAKTNVAFIEDV